MAAFSVRRCDRLPHNAGSSRKTAHGSRFGGRAGTCHRQPGSPDRRSDSRSLIGRGPLSVPDAALSARSCLIDGEAIVTDQKGLAVFDLIRGRQPSAAAVLCAFDLLELDGEDLRREPIETRKSTLKSLLRGKHAGIAFNAHFIADGAIVYRQACALGCEGIVSKRLGSLYRSGRADCWLKVKNPAAPAVTREAEEEWN
jgi:hypothetical protein